MSKTLIGLAIVWRACLVGGLVVGAAGLVSAGESHRSGMPHGSTLAQHGSLEVGDSSTPPTVALLVHKDPKAGWNLQVRVANFRFAPEHASTAHVPGEGHAHLFIDGKKVTRLYGEWYHIPTLAPGAHKIAVTLNANSHEDLTVRGKPISDTREVHVPSR